MKLSKRLEKIVDMVPAVPAIADIGTDHGYIPCALLQAGKIQRAIASDINRKPLDKARQTAAWQGLDQAVEFRLGPGLEVLRPGEVQGAVIAGMGGELTREILETSADVVAQLQFIIAQPAQNPEVLRAYFYGGGFRILDEELVREDDGRFYEYFMVRRDPAASPLSADPLDHIASPRLITSRHPLMADFLGARIRELETIQGKLDLAYESSRSKHEVLEHQKQTFREALTWLSD